MWSWRCKKSFFKEEEIYVSNTVKFIKNCVYLHNQFFQLWCDGGLISIF